MNSIPAAALAAALGQPPPTAEQVAVIEAPMSPALVVAGAGSGKTETMAGRVVWLVAHRHLRPDEVLGLTFTRKAAGELAERVQRRLDRLAEWDHHGLIPHLGQLHAEGRLDVFAELEDDPQERQKRARLMVALREHVGGSASSVPGGPLSTDPLFERPTITTYNSFADRIVRENALRAGRDADAAVLSDSAAWLLMRRVILDTDDEQIETRDEALSTLIDAALRIARDSVDNSIQPEQLSEFAREFSEICARPSETSRTAIAAPVRDAWTRVSALHLLAGLAREYDERKRLRGVWDFADQVSTAARLVSEHPEVVAELRQRYRAIVLDEYQDTSVSQTTMLATIFSGSAVMAVGDPHQAIYGWRGASAGNMGGFADDFSAGGGLSRYSLVTSWRNSTTVLTAANALIARSSPTIPVQPLRPRPNAPRGSVQLHTFDDIDTEAAAVAEWFRDVRTSRGAAVTGAILFRSKKHMERFATALGRWNVPHRILGLGGLLSTPEVVDVISVLRVISGVAAGSALVRLLTGPRWNIGLADMRALAELSGRLARHDHRLQPLGSDVVGRLRTSAADDQGSLIDALDFIGRTPDDHSWLGGLTPVARERLREAERVFGGLRCSIGMPIPDLIRLIDAELRLDIELAANESRGPSRVASAQLRAFVDEVHAFLAADDAGTISSLLAWLDHAEKLDEFAPRTEPPELDVVQLLTIHGAKGLEWDAVAVVRCVHDELPARAHSNLGWLATGGLPYQLRGDREWLPQLAWRPDEAPTQQALAAEIRRFTEAVRAAQLAEERRLAYVAVTRARDSLLLTGSAWSGTKKPREPSIFLREIADVLGVTLAESSLEENPYRDEQRTLTWPMDPLGSRRERVSAAAARVRAAAARPRDEPDDTLRLLLAERDQKLPLGLAPVRIAASRYGDYASDYSGTVAAGARPMPERPFRQTRLGTRFHAWVEQRSTLVGRGPALEDLLWTDAEMIGPNPHELPGEAGDAADDLARLQRTFLASEWGQRQPIAVELEINFTQTGRDETRLDDGEHIVICKLDAVYRREDRGGRIEIVDWKTGAAPKSPGDRKHSMTQLHLYRRAYHEKYGVPMDQIDVALFYVSEDVIVRN